MVKKINILSPGRFHLLDLARELHNNGYDVAFYSHVPTKRAVRFGLPKECNHSMFYIMLPFLFLTKVSHGAHWASTLMMVVQDYITQFIMRNCDVCISMSGLFVMSPQRAKKNGAKVIIERGSKHILEQKRILEMIPSLKGKKPVHDSDVKAEMACYNLADYVSIATEHVKRSFLDHHYPVEKLFVNPYGVNLSMFYPKKMEKKYDVIMVGNWSYQKGCDLIFPAINDLKLQFLHVGAILDLFFEENEYCHHHSPVNQSELIDYYNSAKIFIIPSRQEGLAMVQAQAIACNLPMVGSVDSGAEDLKKMVKYPEYVTVIDNYSVDALKKAIIVALEKYETMGSVVYAGDAVKNLTWEAYGKRYADFLTTL